MNKEELIEKLQTLATRFHEDDEVVSLTKKLKERFESLYAETFTMEELESDEMQEVYEEYYSELREDDPDNATIFQVMWFSE